MTRIASFDVFETVLVRAVGDPAAVFLLLGRQLRAIGSLSLEPAAFASARLRAEERARRRRPDVDTTLSKIYDELGHALRLDVESIRSFASAELALEDRLIRAPAGALDSVEEARNGGCRIVFVSDSYLPRDFVQHALQSRGLWQRGDGLYVSSDRHGANKRSGALYDLVRTTESVPPNTITHVGNHAVADVKRARAAGFGTHHHMAGNLRPDEELLEKHQIATTGLTSVLAGASRLARLSAPSSSDRDAVIRDVASTVASPTLIAYVIWVLSEASRRGISRLYFLAREGQVLFEIASIIAPKLGASIDIRYLLVSRQSLNLAAIREVTSTEVAWALTNVETNTVRTMLQRLGIDAEEVGPQLSSLDCASHDIDSVPSPSLRERLIENLIDGNLRSSLNGGLERGRDLVFKYLRQEGVLDPLSIGFVDTTGAGSQLRALARIRSGQGLSRPTGMLFYRKAASASAGYDDAGELVAWYEDQVLELGCGLPPGRAALIEVFAAADHGTVLGYAMAETQVDAQLAPSSAELSTWGLDLMRRTIIDAAHHVVLDPQLIDPESDVREAVREVMMRLRTSPSPEEARVWGQFPFEGTSGLDVSRPLARPYAIGEVVTSSLSGRLVVDNWYFWPEAAEILSPRLVQFCIRMARAAKPRLQRFRRIWLRLVSSQGFLKP